MMFLVFWLPLQCTIAHQAYCLTCYFMLEKIDQSDFTDLN